MPLPIQDFDTIVNQQATAMQANSPVILNFNEDQNGNSSSVLLALIRSNAANSIWLQALATTLLAVTRLTTSSGTDVDTFIADFGFQRYSGSAASGTLNFSRYTDTVEGIVPIGTIVSIGGTNINFAVTLDTTNPNYNSGLNAYVLPISTLSISVPATCETNGTIGNVSSGTINTINNPTLTPYVDNVTNPSPFTMGTDSWSDTQTKQAFILYINSLSRATLQAIEFAVISAISTDKTRVVRYNVVENYNEAGNPQPGYFYVVIDNGSGSQVSNQLLAAVNANVELYRGLTIAYNVDKATFIPITIVLYVHLVSQPTETQAQITANINAALTNYSLGLDFNEVFSYTRIAEVVYDSDQNIALLPSNPPYTLNGNSINADVSGNNLSVFGIPTVTVNYV